MKTAILLFLIVLLSCQEDIVFPDTNFIKVYGLDGASFGTSIMETADGGFLITGRVEKTPFDNNETINGPFIMKTDQNGNETFFRTYSFTRGTLKVQADSLMEEYLMFNPSATDLNETITFDYEFRAPTFERIIPLNNGNYFVWGSMTGELDVNYWDFFFFYMILDSEYSPIKFRFLNNSSIEIGTPIKLRYFDVNRGPIVVALDNGNVMLMSSWSYDGFYGDRIGYSIYKISEDGVIISIWDYCNSGELFTSCSGDDINLPARFPFNIILNSASELVVAGQYQAVDGDMWVQKIDAGTGNVLDIATWGRGAFELGGIIQPSNNGYAMLEYHNDTIGDFKRENGERRAIGALLFVDENLDSLRHVHITECEVAQAHHFIRTRDGGYIAGFSRIINSKNDFLVVRTDAEGNTLWRREFAMTEARSRSGRDDLWDIIETQDGGIVLLFSPDFNSSGDRVSIIKLNAYGTF